MPETTPSKINDVQAELNALHAELRLFNTHRFVRIHNSMWRLISFQFIRGLAFGLGSVIGATMLVSALVYIFSSFNFIPIIGEWGAQIADMISQNRSAP